MDVTAPTLSGPPVAVRLVTGVVPPTVAIVVAPVLLIVKLWAPSTGPFSAMEFPVTIVSVVSAPSVTAPLYT